jgi:hypothetical protein
MKIMLKSCEAFKIVTYHHASKSEIYGGPLDLFYKSLYLWLKSKM